jgi:hypothetical protein
MTCIDQWIILAYVQIFLYFGAIRFKFHDRINQRSISFQSTFLGTAQDDKHFCALWWYAKLCLNRNKHPRSMQRAYLWSHTRSANQRVNINQGLPIDVPFYLILFTHVALCTKSKGIPIGMSFCPYTSYTRRVTYKKQGAPNRCHVLYNTFYMRSVIGSWLTYDHTFHTQQSSAYEKQWASIYAYPPSKYSAKLFHTSF